MPDTQVLHAAQVAAFVVVLKVPLTHPVQVRSVVVLPSTAALPARQSVHTTQRGRVAVVIPGAGFARSLWRRFAGAVRPGFARRAHGRSGRGSHFRLLGTRGARADGHAGRLVRGGGVGSGFARSASSVGDGVTRDVNVGSSVARRPRPAARGVGRRVEASARAHGARPSLRRRSLGVGHVRARQAGPGRATSRGLTSRRDADRIAAAGREQEQGAEWEADNWLPFCRSPSGRDGHAVDAPSNGSTSDASRKSHEAMFGYPAPLFGYPAPLSATSRQFRAFP